MVSFPALDLPAIHARKQIEIHQELSETARYEKVLQDLNGQREKARIQLESARRVAQQTPALLEAAQAIERQATGRYKAGLGTVIEIADAQRLLTQAQMDDSLAKLNVWRALLALAAAEGDLQPFLSETGK